MEHRHLRLVAAVGLGDAPQLDDRAGLVAGWTRGRRCRRPPSRVLSGGRGGHQGVELVALDVRVETRGTASARTSYIVPGPPDDQAKPKIALARSITSYPSK